MDFNAMIGRPNATVTVSTEALLVREACMFLEIRKTTVFKLVSKRRLHATKLGRRSVVRGGGIERLVQSLPVT